MLLYYLNTIQIHSRHGSHSDINSKSKYSYSSDTLQARTPFFRSHRLSLQIQFKCIPNADTILMLILLTYSFAIQQIFLDGIFKPISDKTLSHLQMASLSPFPHPCFDECKFTGTLVSNLLLPSRRERQTCQSNSSGSRRLNRGNCCTPKFALAFFHEK